MGLQLSLCWELPEQPIMMNMLLGNIVLPESHDWCVWLPSGEKAA
jgi:hypothetical protein